MSYLDQDSGWIWVINETQIQVGLGFFYQRIRLRVDASERRLRLGLGSYLDPDSGWVRGHIEAQTQVWFGVT